MPQRWSAEDVPDLSGRVAVITGATGGIGLETAKVLSSRSALVIATGRSELKLAAAAEAIERGPGAPAESLLLDLADLSSVAAAAAEIQRRHSSIDLLINNAGVMAVSVRGETVDGFELQFGTNHLGHYALTAALAPLIAPTVGARVVTVSSTAHHYGRIDFDNLHLTRRYAAWGAYGQSKLANLLFTQELERRFRSAGAAAISVAAHPGTAATDLQRHSRPARLAVRLLGQSSAGGALPILYAATSPEVRGGGYYGPTGAFGQRGGAGQARVGRRALEPTAALELWGASERETGIVFPDLAAT